MRYRDASGTPDDAALERLLDGLIADSVTLQDAMQALDRLEHARTEGYSS
ncbi:hypothetical protein [Tahibacter sp.]|nr:hypothetical protein [Tahibacter sp.]